MFLYYFSILFFMFNIILKSESAFESHDCHPSPNINQPQFLIGYGSLINEESKLRTMPNAGTSTPVTVHGFERTWNARGHSKNLPTTFLGVVQKSKANFNAVIFQIPINMTDDPFAAVDEREYIYCRHRIDIKQINFLVSHQGLRNDFPVPQIWIYVTKPIDTGNPSLKFPIIMTYADIFLTGCLQIRNRYQLSDFAANCVLQTQSWNSNICNNRNLSTSTPYTKCVNNLLRENLPELRYTLEKRLYPLKYFKISSRMSMR